VLRTFSNVEECAIFLFLIEAELLADFVEVNAADRPSLLRRNNDRLLARFRKRIVAPFGPVQFLPFNLQKLLHIPKPRLRWAGTDSLDKLFALAHALSTMVPNTVPPIKLFWGRFCQESVSISSHGFGRF
jgi:hypothetical protein